MSFFCTSVTIGYSVTSIGDGAFRYCKNLTIYGFFNSYAETYAKNNSIPFVYLNHMKATCDEAGVYTINSVFDGEREITGKIAAAIYDDKGVLVEIQMLDAKATQTVKFQNKLADGSVKFIWFSDGEKFSPVSDMLEMDI